VDNLLKVMTCGSVDDGKSTLLGRILFETNNIYQDQSNYLSSSSQLQDGSLDYSLLLDGLIDEKEQGITIDLAFKYLNYKNKNIIFIDSPGHKEFTKNTAYAATLADIAIVLVDSTKGISEQTKNHLEIISIFKQIETVIFAVNKLDIAEDPQLVFYQIKNELEIMCGNLSISDFNIVPISALKGDNVIKKSNIVKNYNGNPLIDILSSIKIKEKDDLQTTIPVQSIKKDFKLGRLVFCEKLGEDFKIGEKLINYSTKRKSSRRKNLCRF
jgi:sulfate adenylyltransferase subunit 1 (EFTu-like GTPase family)